MHAQLTGYNICPPHVLGPVNSTVVHALRSKTILALHSIQGTWSVFIRLAAGGMRFNMGFWGLTFPLGVFTSGTISLGKALPSAFFSYLSLVLIGALALLWLVVALGTLRGALDGTLLVAPCMSDLKTDLKTAPPPDKDAAANGAPAMTPPV